ncbi:MAG: site-specific integrase, partial [Proteobacteria bacterium]|nr:site-specific integrase [Pseudomonadota bacterium]
MSAINRYFAFFSDSGKEFLDQIRPIDIQMLIKSLHKSDKSEPTIKNAVSMIKKVYNCLIDELKILECETPVAKRIRLPKKNELVRDRLPTDDEISALLDAEKFNQQSVHSTSPINEIIRFIIFTGARRSEVLHAEWEDFDLDKCIWRLRIKPNCPTQYKLGWAPKWHKERDVLLFPEVIDLLRSLKRVRSIGKVPVRSEAGEILDHKSYPANFVFPKKETIKLET